MCGRYVAFTDSEHEEIQSDIDEVSEKFLYCVFHNFTS